jgi:hypothetical protein
MAIPRHRISQATHRTVDIFQSDEVQDKLSSWRVITLKNSSIASIEERPAFPQNDKTWRKKQSRPTVRIDHESCGKRH